MSAMGQKRTFRKRVLSICFLPQADITELL